MTTERLPTRIKSAAFLRKPDIKQIATSTRPSSLDSHQQHFSQIPVSQSRFSISGLKENEKINQRAASATRFVSLKTNVSNTSQIWRQVNTTKSQLRLNSLCNNGQESVRINLLQKVDRIKSKHKEKQQFYQNCISAISWKILQRVRTINQQKITGNLHLKIMELIAPFQIEKQRAEQRYRTRLLRIKKV